MAPETLNAPRLLSDPSAPSLASVPSTLSIGCNPNTRSIPSSPSTASTLSRAFGVVWVFPAVQVFPRYSGRSSLSRTPSILPLYGFVGTGLLHGILNWLELTPVLVKSWGGYGRVH